MKNYFWTLFFIIFFIEMFSLLPNHSNTEARKPNELYGIIHVHSKFSDGGDSIPEIAEAGKKAGLDFIVITDHNNSTARREGFEHAYDNLDIFVEVESSTLVGHALTFYSHTPLVNESDEAINKISYQHFLNPSVHPEIFLVTAHPSNIKNPWGRLDRFSEGIEVVNFDSAWQRQLSNSMFDFFGTIFIMPFNQYLSALRFFEIHPKDLLAWDSISSVSQDKHFAILAQDTHSKLKINNDYALPWPGYLETFKLANNVLFLKEPLSTDFESRKKQIYQALRQGRLAFAFNTVFPYSGNKMEFNCAGITATSGDSLTFARDCKLTIDLPEHFPFRSHIRILRNGELYKDIVTDQKKNTLQIEQAGSYRVEVWAQGHTLLRSMLNQDIPYVFYNPIFLL